MITRDEQDLLDGRAEGGPRQGGGRIWFDAFPECAARYRETHAMAVVDVLRSMTVAVTALARGQRVFPVASVDEAFRAAARLDRPVLCGEQKGYLVDGFELNNSPYHIERFEDVSRPLVLLSSAGTKLLVEAAGRRPVYAACLRNFGAVARALGAQPGEVAILEAGTQSQRRVEDSLVCAWIATRLLARGYRPGDEGATAYLAELAAARLEDIGTGPSAAFLRRTDQLHDLTFVLEHVDDLDIAPRMDGTELVAG